MNAMYQIIFSMRKVELKPEVRLWKSQMKAYIPVLTPKADSFLFKLDVIYYYNFYFKNGKFRKVDSQNLGKVLTDAIAEKNGIGDEYFKFGSYESYHSDDKEYCECILSQVTLDKEEAKAA